MDRRRFLTLAGAAPLALGAAPLLAQEPAAPPGAARPPGPGRTLLLVQLEGGNDGLNTVIPYRDPNYPAVRGPLALPHKEVLRLDDEVGLHPALAPLSYAWDGKELAVIKGTGVPGAGWSHSLASAAWCAGRPAPLPLSQGWLGAALASIGPEALALHGASLCADAPGALMGGRWARLAQPAEWKQQVTREARAAKAGGPVLAHLLGAQRELREHQRVIQEWGARAPEPHARFPDTSLGRQLAWASRLLISRAPLGALQVTHRGYDTHQDQARRHAQQLKELAEGLSALRSEMLRANTWSEVLVLVWTEFGRTPAPNRTGGTEHGTSSPTLALGGAVRGGVYGQRPALNDLVEGRLKTPVDARRVMATVLRRWWGLQQGPLAGDPQWQALDFLG